MDVIDIYLRCNYLSFFYNFLREKVIKLNHTINSFNLGEDTFFKLIFDQYINKMKNNSKNIATII